MAFVETTEDCDCDKEVPSLLDNDLPPLDSPKSEDSSCCVLERWISASCCLSVRQNVSKSAA